jgi:hypothetical protein
MFKKVALILTVVTSLAIANAKAYDSAFSNASGHAFAHIGNPMTIERVDQSSIRVQWTAHYRSHDAGSHNTSHEATFYLSAKTVFSGGTQANAVKGATVHVTYHFEGGRAVADTVTFANS